MTSNYLRNKDKLRERFNYLRPNILYGTAIPFRKFDAFCFSKYLRSVNGCNLLEQLNLVDTSMNKNRMRPLTEVEMKETYGGRTWLASAWKWIKDHFFARTNNDPNCRVEVGERVEF